MEEILTEAEKYSTKAKLPSSLVNCINEADRTRTMCMLIGKQKSRKYRAGKVDFSPFLNTIGAAIPFLKAVI